MVDLLDKYKPLLERMHAVEQAGSRIGPVNERLLSPTRAIINGRDTILAGTNNYMGVTFERECIEAGQKALEEFGTGTTGSRIANGSYAIHEELERELASFLGMKQCISHSRELLQPANLTPIYATEDRCVPNEIHGIAPL